MLLYRILDIFFIVFHTLLILFNLTGWILPRTRRLHLLSIGLTAFSWLILGIWYGIGYCPLTEWHWNIRHLLGYREMPYSYIKFLLDLLTGLDWDPQLVDMLAALLFAAALILSIIFNLRDRLKRTHTG